jgi:hypothetical protein
MLSASDPAVELPRYKCHKEVQALKIRSIYTETVPEGLPLQPRTFLFFDEPGYAPRQVSPEYVAKHRPQPGWYFVVYEDGYESASPARAFEEGYTRI